MTSFHELSGAGQFRRMRKLGWKALAAYNLSPNNARMTPLEHCENTTFRVRRTDGGPEHVLRIHRTDYQTEASIASELAWTQAIRDELDIPTPEAVVSQTGARIQRVHADGIPEARHVVLFKWLDGRFRNRGLRADELALIGRTMARLHNHGASWKVPDGFVRFRWDVHTMLPDDSIWREILASTELEDTESLLLEAFRSQLVEHLERWGTSPERFGLVHADLHSGNVLFHRDGIRVIDFDDCGHSYYCADVATALMSVRNRPDRVSAFLEGYRAERAFGPEDESMLPVFYRVRELFELRWVMERQDNPSVFKYLARSLRRCLKAAVICQT